MATANEPALGLTGTLTALQAQPPMTAAPNTQAVAPAMASAGGENLERAARSLESVQGNVAGQTQAIKQMSMAGQQQTVGLQMLMSQLGTQVTSLMQAVNQLSVSMTMSAMPSMSAMAQPVPSPMGIGGMNMARSVGGGIMSAGGSMAGGLSSYGRPFGAMGEMAASPFLGTPVYPSDASQFGPQLSGDAGVMRGMAMTTGLGIQPEMLKFGGGERIRQLGSERLQKSFGDTVLGAAGGGARLGSSLGSDFLGFGAARVMGMGGFGSMLAGSVIGMPIAAAAGASIDEVMDQSAMIRGGGDQFARSAHRFMPTSGMGFGQLRRPGMQSRQRVGRSMNRMAIEDLTLNNEDVREMFAGVTQQDLMRGVGNVDEVVQRFRDTKETFKMIGRRMGQGLQEAAGTMGALQGLGFDPSGQRGRSAIFGASSVMGLTPSEAMQRGIGSGQQGTAMGIGREMFGIGIQGAQLAQSAIQSGALTNVQTAALGGREAAGGLMPQMMMNFLQSPMGRATLLAGATPGGFNMGAVQGLGARQVMGRAGDKANADINSLIDIELGGEEQAREFLQDPQAFGAVLGQVRSVARTFEQTGANPHNAMRMALKQTVMQGATGEQLSAALKMIKEMPESRRKEGMQRAREMADEFGTQTSEDLAMWAQTKRSLKRAFTPISEGAVGMVAAGGAALSRSMTSIHRGLTGIEPKYMGRDLDMDALSAVTTRGTGSGVFENEEMEVVPETTVNNVGDVALIKERNRHREQRNALRTDQEMIYGEKVSVPMRAEAQRTVANARSKNKEAVENIVEQLRTSTSPGERRTLSTKLMTLLSDGTYGKFDSKKQRGRMMKRALQDAVQSTTGADIGSHFAGRELDKLAPVDTQKAKELAGDISSLLDLDDNFKARELANPEVKAWLEARVYGTGGDLVALKKAAREAGGESFEKLEANLNKGRETEGFWDTAGGLFTHWTADTGEDRGAKILEMLGDDESGLIGLGRKESARTRAIDIAGGASSDAIRRLGEVEKGKFSGALSNFTPGLRTKNSGDVSQALGGLIGKITDPQLAALTKAGGHDRFVEVMTVLKDVNLENKIQRSEREAIAKVININADSEHMNMVVDRANQTGDLGFAALAALSGGKMPQSMLLGRPGTGLTEGQGAQMLEVSTQLTRTLHMIDELALIIADLKMR